MKKIKERLQKLNEVEKILKSEFIGIDSIIDKILESITPWYVTPEIITRPTVVSLWGLTGTGKTSVVKRIMNLLDLEKDMLYFNCATEVDSGKDSIESKIFTFFEDENGNTSSGSSSYDSDQQLKTNSKRAIMVFDEFQNCRTLDEHGEERDRSQTASVWQILDSGILESTEWSWEITRMLGVIEEIHSLAVLHPTIPIKDGRFTVMGEELEKIEEGFREYLDYQGLYDFNNGTSSVLSRFDEDGMPEIDDEEEKKCPYIIPQGIIKTIVRRYNSRGKGEGWKERTKLRACTTLGEFAEYLQEYSKEMSAPKKVDCSESLVFVIGNLDEAFGVTDDIDPDIDADILTQLTSNVTITDVKNSLKRRFRLEQISRLGNNMILYPSLSANNFKEIIDLELNKITKNFKELSGFEIEFSDVMKRLIYSEAVYPVQGVRPIQSSLSTLITPKLSKILINCPENSKKAVISVEKDCFEVPSATLIVTYDTGEVISLNQELTLGALRDISQYPKIYLHAIHEAGHAAVYTKLTGKFPETIVAITTNGGGYMWKGNEPGALRREAETVEDIKNDIMVSYAGLVSEEYFFAHGPKGDSDRMSIGATSDIQCAWDNLATLVYDAGYGDNLVKYRTPEGFPAGLNPQIALPKEAIDSKIVELSAELYKSTWEIIKQEEDLIREVALYLGEHRKMNKETFKGFWGKYHPETQGESKDWYKNILLGI